MESPDLINTVVVVWGAGVGRDDRSDPHGSVYLCVCVSECVSRSKPYCDTPLNNRHSSVCVCVCDL